MVSQNTLFPVIPFHNLSDCDLYTPPTTGREGETETGGDENDQLGHNQELVPKRGTTYVAWLLGVDRYVFFRADADTDYYRSSRPITDILNRYTCLV